jgi:NTE family protein
VRRKRAPPFRKLPWEKFLHNSYALEQSPMSCPNQFNPVNLNPLRRDEQRHEQPKLERRH